MKPIKLTLKLRADSPPHLYISKVKELMINDKELHKDMKNLLLYLKKTRQSYVPLSHTQEVILDLDNHRHFERGVEPQVSAWIMKEMDPEEIEEYTEDDKKYFEEILNYYNKIGYDFFNKEDVDNETIESLVKITKPAKGKNKMRFKRK